MQNCIRLIFCVLVLAPLVNLFGLATIQAQDQCGKELTEAEEKYGRGRLNEVIALVNGCLEKSGLAVTEKQRAYKLLGKAYHAKGLLDNAKENLRKLLELIPNWQPDPKTDPPSFQRLAEEVIKEKEIKQKEIEREQARQKELEEKRPSRNRFPPEPTKKTGSKKWLWIAGGGTVATVTVVILASAGGDTPSGDLPNPPGLPTRK